jgi:glycosyltransferase involved in cell wall biosynthesis
MARQAITPHNPLEGERPDLTISLHDGTDEQISIVIVHKDAPEHLSVCLQTICFCSTANNYEIIVVDNGSGQDSLDYLEQLESDGEVKVVRNQKNLWWSEACNKGVAAADPNSKYIVFMHCDVVVLNPAWLDLMINVSESQGAGIVGVQLQTYKLGEQRVDFVAEWCMLLTRECWNDIGPWNPELPQVGHSFLMTISAQQKGYKPQVITKNHLCHHYQIFNLNTNEWERLTEQAMAALPNLMRMSRDV